MNRPALTLTSRFFQPMVTAGLIFFVAGTAVAVPPVITRPASIAPTEDTAFAFTGGNLISVADPDAGTTNVTFTIQCSPQVFTLTATGSLSSITGNGSSTVRMVGSQANVNTALASLTMNPFLNATGSISILVTCTDNTASVDSEVIPGLIASVNDRPILSLPGTSVVNEEGQIVLPISNLDPDRIGSSGYTFRFSMSATNGVFTLGSTNNLTFTAGTPLVTTGGVIVITNATFEGPYVEMSNALAGIVYLPRLNASGGDNLIFSANDLGNFGSGGALSSNITRTITINAVNDRPELNLPPIVVLDENAVEPINLSGGITDIDVNETPGGEMRVLLSVTNGVLNLTVTNGLDFISGANGTTGMTFEATLANIDNALATLTYTPSNFFFGFDHLRVNASDLGNTGSGGTLTTNSTILLQIDEVNYAPELDSSSPMNLTSINEDNVSSAGNTVASILATAGTPITDIDPGALQGIAVIDADITGGTWQYSTNAGVSFASFGGVLDGAALLLNTSARIRFVPDADYFGTNTFTFRAWDRFSGANGDTGADSSINGGNSAFSTNTASPSIIVLPINDAPVVDNSADAVFPDQLEDDFAPVGTAVSNLLSTLNGLGATDADAGDLIGVAITSQDAANGDWEISTNGGSSYISMGAVSASSARLLDDEAFIRFIPDTNFFGTATITFRAWDQTTGTNLGFVDATVNGGSTAFSSLIATGRVTVLDVNEAPLLDGNALMTLSSILANTFDSSGDPVSNIINSAGNPITDTDVSDPEGFAVVAVDDQFGLWQFSTDDGGSWNILGPVTDSSSTLLGLDALIRFIPLPNFSGSATISVRAWDQETGSSGLGGIDTSVNGGSTAFSTNFVDVSILVTSTNTAPVIDNTGNMLLTSIFQDDTNSPGDSVVSIVTSAGGDRITDADPGSLEGFAVIGVDDADGTWQYSINAGGSWLAFGAVSDSNAILLDQDGLIRFIPDPGFFGNAEVVFRAWDQSSLFVSGATGVNAAVNGGTTPFSSGIETARIDVIELGSNVAPFLNNSGDMKLPDIFQNNFTNKGAKVSAILASDIANAIVDIDGDPEGIAIIAADFSNGVWQYSLNNGTNWNALNNISSSLAVLLDTNALVRFVPNANFNGAAGDITIRAWDRSDSNLSGATGVDTSINGGSAPFSAQTESVRIEIVPMSDFVLHNVPLSTPVAGTLLTYSITVTNQGPTDSTNVVVTDVLPPEVVPTGVVVTNLTTIFAGGRKSFTLTVAIPPSARGALTNIASVTGEYVDFTPANSVVTNITPISAVADLVLTVSNQPGKGASADVLNYYLSVTNKGPGDALALTITNTLATGVEFVSASNGVLNLNNVIFGPVVLSVNGSTSFSIRVRVPNTVGAVLTNVATVTSSETDPVPTNNTVSTVAPVVSGNSMTDFDGDGKGDVSIFEPSTGKWFIQRSSDNTLFQLNWGYSASIPVPADYDGDGLVDVAVFDPPTGNWYIRQSLNSQLRVKNWGYSASRPVPSDYDGDGKADIAVFDPPSGNWFILQSSNNTLRTKNWGYSASRPVPGDYDGDGKSDIAVFDPPSGNWFILQSSNNTMRTKNWGYSASRAVPGDYDGDAKTDIAVFDPPSGNWFIFMSATETLFTKNWGYSAARPVPADYDGDGKTDIAVYDPPTGNWFIFESATLTLRQENWGYSGAVPVVVQP